MPTKSELVLPPKALASCIAGVIVRDTRSAMLSDTERLNYFPGSPLFTGTLTIEGKIHLSDELATVQELRRLPPVGKRLFQTPKNEPHSSWSPGPLLALTIAFFPDAWLRLGGKPEGEPPEEILQALTHLETSFLDGNWSLFWETMTDIWNERKEDDRFATWSGSSRIREWAYYILGQFPSTGAGRSLRSAQRRLLQWTGHNKKTLEFFAKVEDVHRLSIQNPNTTAAELALNAGFSDQSHMGRFLKRATGFSPAELNSRIATDEAFWCYRLLGERF